MAMKIATPSCPTVKLPRLHKATLSVVEETCCQKTNDMATRRNASNAKFRRPPWAGVSVDSTEALSKALSRSESLVLRLENEAPCVRLSAVHLAGNSPA